MLEKGLCKENDRPYIPQEGPLEVAGCEGTGSLTENAPLWPVLWGAGGFAHSNPQ